MSKIIVSHVYPPIPNREWDWCAYHDDDVELPWTYGWGKTCEEALADLARLDQECAESEENDQERFEFEMRDRS